jgi:hypothetical protein
MSATALAVAEASKQAMYEDEIMDMARDLIDARNIADDEQMLHILFQYSAQLIALTANLVTSVLLTEEQMTAMMSELKEFQELGKEME